ncbi:motility associated factor glycosyltransferase family protein [Lysinibacillus sp. NPDC056232]|uniref:motility associated factor glycosyltransferase family protein n=1 Tax=Lysinibacillus sp. NPDC056232 TaxID=3345756 RepID=UPI0035E11299
MEFQIEHLYSKNDLPILKINNFFLHSKYNPIREAEQFVHNKFEENNIHILLGYGSGYIVNAFLNKFQFKEKLIVIDPFMETELINVQEEHKEQKNLVFFKSEQIEHLAYFLRKMEVQDYQTAFTVVVSPNYDKFFGKLHLEVLKQVKESQYRSIIDINTIYKSTDLWQKNIIKSLFYLQTDVSLNVLRNKYEMPVIVASGGPSLTKQLPLLKQIEKKVIIIAAGSTINSLLAYDIVPDYVVAIDGSVEAYMHFRNNTFDNSRLIYTPSNYSEIRKSFNSVAYLFGIKSGDLESILKNKFQIEVPLIRGGGTVAQYSLHVARFISSGPIALIGQDLAYTNNQTHAENNERFEVVELSDLDEKMHFFIKGYNEKPVLTSTVFYDMKRDFERLITLLEKPEWIFNCTEGGVKLEGYNQISFISFINQYVYINEINKFEVLKDASQSNVSKKEIIKYLTESLEIYSFIKKHLNSGIKLLSGNIKLSPNQIKKLKTINLEIDNSFKNIPIEEMISKIKYSASRIYLEKQNETSLEKNERVIKGTLYIFQQLLESIDTIEHYTKELLMERSI